jgi:integrase
MPRVSPSPFLRGNSWWARIPRLAAPAVQRPLGVLGATNRDVALEVCRFLAWCKGRRESFLLDAIAENKTTAGEAHTAYVENRLTTFIVELRDGVTDTDIEPYVMRWQKELTRRKKPNAETRAKYLRQVRTLLIEGTPFRRSAFTKQRIRDWLSSLEIEQPNRYRAALSSFAEYLVFEDVLPGNPVRLVPMAAESEPRTKHLSQLDAKKLIAAFDPGMKYKALHALMLATGMEFGAARMVDPATITDNSAFADGTKRAHRRRTVTIPERWQWAWEIARDEILNYGDGQRPLASISVYQSARALARALKAAKLDESYTQHDHRHTWAVQAIRDGIPLHVVAHQLGHRDATMVLKVYGRFVPTSADFRTRSATSTATEQMRPEPTK